MKKHKKKGYRSGTQVAMMQCHKSGGPHRDKRERRTKKVDWKREEEQ